MKKFLFLVIYIYDPQHARLLFCHLFGVDKARQISNNFGTVTPDRILPSPYLLIHADPWSDSKL